MIIIGKIQKEMIEPKLCKIRRIKVNKFEKVETGNGKYKIIVRLYSYQENRSKIFIDDSELTRIIKHLNPKDNCFVGKYEYIKDLISIKVGKSKKYKLLIEDENNRTIDNIGEIEIHNYKYDKVSRQSKLVSIEIFTHLISNASHIRGQKALFVKKELFEPVDEILRCGVNPEAKTKYINKWTSYYGLQASNSVAVTMPKCTIISDLYLNIDDIVDKVYQDYKSGCDAGTEIIDKFEYKVLQDKDGTVKTCPFDGMGIVDIKMARQWAKDLGLDYVPGSFQIRLCGVKGCLFVMPIETFIEKVSKTSLLKDIDGNIQDYNNGDFNVILTKSMFKYEKFYNEEKKLEQWKREFSKEVYGYRRTFNICSYAVKYEDLKDELLTAYQPLQTLDKLFDLEKDDREKKLHNLCGRTVRIIKSMHSDIDTFLKYIGIDEEDEKDKEKLYKKSVKPYYRALSENHSLCNDRYVKMKMEKTLIAAKEKTYIGKLYMDGNYTVVGSDPYALLQHAFGLKVTGLLNRDEVYSNYWNKKQVTSVNVWRNPHIYREHWIGKCMDGENISEWFKYLEANIIVSIWDTNLLRCNSADTDGDTLATVKNEILEKEVSNILKKGKARTVYPDLLSEREDCSRDIAEVYISDTKAIIESELRGFSNDIGEVINKISELWGEKQTATTEEYIETLSVIASLVIDFVKTGIKVPIPKYITDYIDKNKIKKLRFMMYLPNNKKARQKEEKELCLYKNEKAKAGKNGETFDKSFVSKFSDKPCTLNYIMEYMKKELEGIEPSYNEAEFDYMTLLNTKDSNLSKKSHYVKIRNLLGQYVKDQSSISSDRKKEMINNSRAKEEYNMMYKAFYDTCRSELLCVCNEKGKVCTKSMILDCCIICCYTEFKDENYSHFDLLWNLFPEELVRRAGGRDVVQKKVDENLKKSLEKKREKNTEKYEALKNQKKSKIECLETNKFVPEDFTIYKSDITRIKNRIPTSVDNYIEVRKVYYSYLVAYKRLKSMKKVGNIPCLDNSKNCMNNKCIEEITKLNNGQIKKAIKTLEDMEIIKFHKGEHKGRRYKDCELLFIPETGNIDEFYYNGMNYMKAFNVMHRHLSR